MADMFAKAAAYDVLLGRWSPQIPELPLTLSVRTAPTSVSEVELQQGDTDLLYPVPGRST